MGIQDTNRALNETAVLLQAGFSLADAQAPNLSLHGDTLYLVFIDWSKEEVRVKFTQVEDAGWTEQAPRDPDTLDGAVVELFNSNSLRELTEFQPNTHEAGVRHFRLCFNRHGVLDVFASDMHLAPQGEEATDPADDAQFQELRRPGRLRIAGYYGVRALVFLHGMLVTVVGVSTATDAAHAEPRLGWPAWIERPLAAGIIGCGITLWTGPGTWPGNSRGSWFGWLSAELVHVCVFEGARRTGTLPQALMNSAIALLITVPPLVFRRWADRSRSLKRAFLVPIQDYRATEL